MHFANSSNCTKRCPRKCDSLCSPEAPTSSAEAVPSPRSAASLPLTRDLLYPLFSLGFFFT